MRRMVCVLVLMSCMSLAVMPTSASDYTLGIFGNANMDDTISEDDITYVEGIIDGTNDVTELADANYDGVIDEDDISQIELIICGEEEELTLIDQADRTVTVPRPIERVVTVRPDDTRIIVALGGCDKLVGVDRHMRMDYCICYGASYEYCPDDSPCKHICGGKFEEYPDLNRGKSMEVIVSLRPDVIFSGITGSSSSAETLEEKTGVPVICTKPSGHNFDQMYEHIKFMGTVLDKEEEAEELISISKEKIDKVNEITSGIPDDEKPKVYFSTRGYSSTMGGITRTVNSYEPLDIAGGINVAKDVLPQEPGSTSVDVSKEQIIAWNPDIIIIATGYGAYQAGWTDPVESALADPDFQTMDAIKNCRVYHAIYPYSCGRPQDRNLVATMYLAKLLHPDKFEDLDLEEEGNEIYERFLGVDGLFTEYARYLYWLREWLDSL